MEMNRQFRPSEPPRGHSGLIPGVVLVGIGALFFLNNLHLVYVRDWLRFWPAILIAIGIVKLVDSPFPGGRVAGGLLMGVGAVLLAQTLGYLDGMSIRDLWPLILIGLGVLLLFQRTFNWNEAVGHRTMQAGGLNEVALFGGGKRIITTQDFKGGEATAVFGGFELDLRKAGMAGDSATVELNAIFGGIELKVPQTWSVVLQGAGVFGGYTDESLQPDDRIPGAKLLYCKGAAIFGGVVIKN